MWNIRNSTEEHKGREGKRNGKKSEGETNHERLWTLGNKLRVTEGRGWGEGSNWVKWVLSRVHVVMSTGC